MILSDFDLKSYIDGKRLIVEPFSKDIIRENGIDLRLCDEIARHNSALGDDFVIDPESETSVKDEYIVSKEREFVIKAGEQVLLATMEYITMPDNLTGFVELRSTWARHGFFMPPTIIDAGFRGTITLEVMNSSRNGIKLRAGLRFAHVIFATTLNRVENAYKGFYTGQNMVKIPKVINELAPKEFQK